MSQTAYLDLPEGLFEGSPERKTIKFRQQQSVDQVQLFPLLKHVCVLIDE
ncbi:hypothetical protein [Bacillus sp. FJAT-28004]|nr:hypothetical protein [Bacillus sp. FJAT-28004]